MVLHCNPSRTQQLTAQLHISNFRVYIQSLITAALVRDDNTGCLLPGPPGVSPNPLKQVLDSIGESVECAIYDKVFSRLTPMACPA